MVRRVPKSLRTPKLPSRPQSPPVKSVTNRVRSTVYTPRVVFTLSSEDLRRDRGEAGLPPTPLFDRRLSEGCNGKLLGKSSTLSESQEV